MGARLTHPLAHTKLRSMIFPFVFILSLVLNPTSFAKTANPAENLYEEAIKFQKAYRYDEAIATLEQVKTKFPYSNFAKLSRLKIADIHYESKNYIQAQYSYQAYSELYPSDENKDYVIFKIGESLYKQLPKGFDRDLSAAKETISVFTTHLSEFPNSIYTKDVTKLKQDVESKLDKKELYIAKFYFKYKHPLAALKRFQKFLNDFPNSSLVPEALAGAAYSAKLINENDVYEKHLATLKSKYPKYEIPKLYIKRFVWTSL